MSSEAVQTKAPAKRASKTAVVSIGKKIDSLFDLRAKKADLEKSVKDLDGQIKDLESELMEQMAKDGVDKASSKAGTVSITEATVANVTDWDAFYPWMAKNKFFHLIQRRTSDPAFRELWEQGKKIPGVQPFPKKKLNVRAS